MSVASDAPTPPAPPDPRRLLCAAQLLAQGEARSVAATMAGLPLGTLKALAGDPDFEELLADCRAVEAMPKPAQDERLLRLVRRSIERALADGRLGAIPSALRLLGLLPTRVPAPPPGEGGGRRATPARGDRGDDDPFCDTLREDYPPDLAAAAEARWGMAPDGDGGWLGPDGLPAMPGRDVEVVEAPGGPARLIDQLGMSLEAAAELVSMLEAAGEDGTEEFNKIGRPEPGPQWDPVTRTLWRWGEPSAVAPAPDEPAPATPDATAAVSAAPAPAPAVPPRDALRARLEDLIARPDGPQTPDELDLAEAVCARLWPKWPAYTGPIDFWALRDVLASRPLTSRELHRLGGSSHATPGRPPPRPGAPPPPRPPPPVEPAPPRYVRHAVERPPKDLKASPTHTIIPFYLPASRSRDGPNGGRG